MFGGRFYDNFLTLIYVQLSDTIRGFEEILKGNLDHLPEQSFYIVGSLDNLSPKKYSYKH